MNRFDAVTAFWRAQSPYWKHGYKNTQLAQRKHIRNRTKSRMSYREAMPSRGPQPQAQRAPLSPSQRGASSSECRHMMIIGFVLCVVFFKPKPVDSMFSSPVAPDSPGFITVPPSAFGANAGIT
jgi:hypothetical protein